MSHLNALLLNFKTKKRVVVTDRLAEQSSNLAAAFKVNLQYLGRVVFNTDGILYPDSVVGTDSHTTMIDGLGVARWGVGGIEAEAAMLGQKLEKLQEEELVDKPFIRKQMKIRFPERRRSGRTVATVKGLEFSYGDQVLFKNANLTIKKGEKVAILGSNGCGKITLLKLIMGMEKPTRGEVLLGEHNVLPNYFEQNQAEALDLDKTVLDTVAEVAEDWRLDDIKGLLGRCNFKADMLDRKVSLLSGGEKVQI